MRHVRLVHLLVPRRVRGTLQFLFFPHARWRDEGTGTPSLAVPTKKLVAGGDRAATLAAVRGDDLGVPGLAAGVRWLGRCSLRMVSPTFREPTLYAITPALVPVPVGRHAAAARRVKGEWLSWEDASRQAVLSPTARRVMEQCHALVDDWSAPAPAAGEEDRHRDWTRRLLAAQAGDLFTFGDLFRDMTPCLRDKTLGAGWGWALRPADIEDALSDTAVQVIEKMHTFDPARGNAWVWVSTLARNAAVGILRQRNRGAALSLSWGEDGSDGWADDGADDPARVNAERDEVEFARRCLAGTLAASEPTARRVWDMWFDDAPYAQIAAEVGLPVGTVATVIHRIRKQNRESVGQAR